MQRAKRQAIRTLNRRFTYAEVPYKRGLGIRHLQVAVMAVTAFLAYTLRTNLSLAIVAIVDKENDTDTPTNSSIPTYDWDEKIQAYVLSSFFWGYVTTQIPAGILSSRFGGHRFLSGGFLISAVLSLALPQCAYIGGWGLVCVNRMLQDISQGMIFPSIFSLLGLWVPPSERSVLATITVSAQLLGTVVSTPVTGFLTSAYGWPSVFYVLGATSAVFGRHVPWKEILMSAPYLSTVFDSALHGTVFITFLTKIPTFLGTVLKFSIEDNGLATALPYMVSWILSYVFSLLCNFLIGRGLILLTAARKLFKFIAHFGGALFIVLLAHAGGSILPVVYLTCVLGLQAGVFVGIQSTFVDLAPNFSGAIYSFSNYVSNCLGVFGPNIVGFIVTEKNGEQLYAVSPSLFHWRSLLPFGLQLITNIYIVLSHDGLSLSLVFGAVVMFLYGGRDHLTPWCINFVGSASQWRNVFYLCAILLVISNIVFMIWGTSDTQYWNWPDVYKNKDEFKKSKKESKLQKEHVPKRVVYTIDVE